MEVWGADMGNAYLEAITKEKIYIVAGPEFEELQGHILVIHKALYGLKNQEVCVDAQGAIICPEFAEPCRVVISC